MSELASESRHSRTTPRDGDRARPDGPCHDPRAAGRPDYPGDSANTTMMGAGAEHILETSRASGVDSTLPEAVASLYRRAIAAGHGAQGWTVLCELVRPRQ